MDWKQAFELGTAIVTSLGGGSAIVFGLSSHLGKLWADRALEKEKHKYAEILQNAKSELDKTTNRYQVQLDALGHIHKLRTTEEFSHLAQLWKHMAILQDAFIPAAGLGLMMVPADPESREKFKAALRQDYEVALAEARKFFLEEKLFIPKEIADCAKLTLAEPIKEKNFYDMRAAHHEHGVRILYTQDLPGFVERFNQGMDELEALMREHIEGTKLALSAGEV